MPDPSPQPTRLGRYEVLGRIATGGMATVYLAKLVGTGGFSREFALKVIHPNLAGESGFKERFLQEAQIASRIRHPNAVATVDAGEARGYAYLALELVDGLTLRQLMVHRDRGFEPDEAAEIVAQVARGLHAMHTVVDEEGQRLGVVHRDMSPHNVMLDRTGRAVLIDLGLAKIEDRELTQVGVLCGKLPYMSPEQARLEPLDARSDVFSLGSVLFELVTGSLPFGDEHNRSTFERIQAADPDDVEAALAVHDVPPWLSEIIAKCLAAHPDGRYACALDLADALDGALREHDVDQGRVRSQLSEIVSAAMPVLGKVHEVGDLESIHPPASRRLRPLRWAFLGAAAMLMVIGSASAFAWLSAPAAIQQRPMGAGSLASDAAEENRALEGVVPRSSRSRDSQADASRADALVDTDGTETEGGSGSSGGPSQAEPPPKARPRRARSSSTKARRRASDLPPNPYATR